MRAPGGLWVALLWAVGCGASVPPTATTSSDGSTDSGPSGLRSDGAIAPATDGSGTGTGGATGTLDAGSGASPGTGGRTTPTGGITGRGGSTPITVTGGATGDGGSITGRATGGALGRGGSTAVPGTGGATSTGGRTTGGTTTLSGTGGRMTGGTTTAPGTGGRSTGGSGGHVDGGSSATPGGSGGSGTGGKSTGGASGQGGSVDAGTTPAGNPHGACTTGVPARGQPVDCSTPTTTVGTGSPASCDFAELQAAVGKGGIITFDCGPAAVTIPITAPLAPPITKDTVIDGGNRVTLDGGGTVQILRWNGTDWMKNPYGVTLQHLTLVNGRATPTEAIPVRPAPCSQGWNDGEGGAVYVRDGNLTVIDCIFLDNQAAPLGPDTGGGAIYVNGSKNGVFIARSTFKGNAASNAGAVGCLFSALHVYDSLFEDNQAIGHDANGADQTKCSYINNDQYETGSGGNGGALYSDGISVDVVLCGSAILGNAAGQNAYGGGLFFTSNDFGGTLTIADTTMTGNTGGHWTVVAEGSVDDAGTAVGTNAKSITISRSTLQGLR